MRLNNEIVTERTLVDMFRRKTTANIEGEICPYCEYVNTAGSTTCVQCYYELNKAPRDQGEELSQELSNSIFDELMSDEDDSWQEGEARDVVLTLDSDPLEVGQYEATNFEEEEPEKIGFMDSESPELHDTVVHKPENIEADDIGEPIEGVQKLDFSKVDPFEEVKEPVHKGRGTVFSPSTPTGLDGDLLGHVGGNELPSLPPDNLYENKIDLTTKSPAPTPASVLPTLPNIPTSPEVVQTQSTIGSKNVQPIPPSVNPKLPPLPEDIPVEEPVTSVEKPSTIWPWESSDPWSPKVVHTKVVLALGQVKGGDTESASKTIDELGPHLSLENVDLIYHVGMVLKQLDRLDDVRFMLKSAKQEFPGNEHVVSALAHLGVEI